MFSIAMLVQAEAGRDPVKISWRIEGCVAIQEDDEGGFYQWRGETYHNAAKWVIEQVDFCLSEMSGRIIPT